MKKLTIEEMKTNLALATDRKSIINSFNEEVDYFIGKFDEDKAWSFIKNLYNTYMVRIAICTMDSITERQIFYIENNVDI